MEDLHRPGPAPIGHRSAFSPSLPRPCRPRAGPCQYSLAADAGFDGEEWPLRVMDARYFLFLAFFQDRHGPGVER
jgi:hypothetical protein